VVVRAHTEALGRIWEPQGAYKSPKVYTRALEHIQEPHGAYGSPTVHTRASGHIWMLGEGGGGEGAHGQGGIHRCEPRKL
jgi:hypothetical protein